MLVSIFPQSNKIDINSGKLQFESKELSDVMQYLISIGLFCGVRKSLYFINKDLIFCVCHVEILHWRILFIKYKPDCHLNSYNLLHIRTYLKIMPPFLNRQCNEQCVVCVRALFSLCMNLRSYRLLNLTSL
jgi:hypothetical protein